MYTYVQGIWILNIRKRWKGNTGVMQKTPNVLTIMLLAGIYRTSEENIRLHADHKDNPIVEVYVKK